MDNKSSINWNAEPPENQHRLNGDFIPNQPGKYLCSQFWGGNWKPYKEVDVFWKDTIVDEDGNTRPDLVYQSLWSEYTPVVHYSRWRRIEEGNEIKQLLEKYLQQLSDTEIVTWKSENSISEWRGSYREMVRYFFDGFIEWLEDNNTTFDQPQEK